MKGIPFRWRKKRRIPLGIFKKAMRGPLGRGWRKSFSGEVGTYIGIRIIVDPAVAFDHGGAP